MLACRDLKVHLPTDPQPWWEIFIGSSRSKELATVANLILGLKMMDDKDEEGTCADLLLASKGFVKPLVGCFNDCESFLWDFQKDAIEKAADQQ